MTTRAKIKAAVLPHGRKVRRLPAGLGRGLRYAVDFQRGDTSVYLGLYELELNRHLRAIARPGYRSFDIGAAEGYDSLILAKLTGGDVVAIEADPKYADMIRANREANPRLPDITPVTAYADAAEGDGQVTVDMLADRHFVPDLLKVDVEGAEADVLRGASAVLEKRRPAILLEVHSREQEWQCLEILRVAGYAPPTVVDRRRWLREQRPLEHNRWLVFPG